MDSLVFSKLLLPIALSMLMFGIGLSLTLDDFRKIAGKPRGLFAGLVSQMIVLPFIAFLIAASVQLPPELKVGIIIIAVCPGGATSNFITYILRGNVALSISITIVNSFLILVTIPALVHIALVWQMGIGHTVDLPLGLTILKMLYITLLPISAGIYIRNRHQKIALNLEKHMRYILPLLFGFIYVVAILGSRQEYPEDVTGLYTSVLPWVVLLNIAAMSIGFLLSRSLRLQKGDQISLTVEIGIQNSALAITIAGSALFLDNYLMAVPAIVYGMFTFISALVFGFLVKKLSR